MRSLPFTRAPHEPSERSVSERLILREEREKSLSSAKLSNTVAPMKRLVPRDLPFHQSSNSLRVRHQTSVKKWNFFWSFSWYLEDWFHVLLRLRTIVSVFFFVTTWTLFLLTFAAIYVRIDRMNIHEDCGLGKEEVDDDGKSFIYAIKFHGAFAFSLETTTTVGYGIPNGGNGFFENCPYLQVTIYFQMLTSMFLNAFLLSFMFARLSRSEARAAQVIFSDKAIINCEVLPNGIKRYMMWVRIYDADSMYPTVEAHVRFYAVKHGSMHSAENAGVRHPIKMEPMRVSRPNDDYGAYLHTSLPTRVMHHIDYFSPLLPPSLHVVGPEDGRFKRDSKFVVDSCGLDLREADSYTGGRDGLRCAICGETYGTVANLIQHIRYSQHMEKHDNVPVIGSHQELEVDAIFKERKSLFQTPESSNGEEDHCDKRIEIEEPTPPWYEEYRNYMRESNIEIVCIMEAIDPIMSGTFQATQSYTVEDVVFDADFAPCILADRVEKYKFVRTRLVRFFRKVFVGRSAVGRSVKVDLDSFHATVKAGEG